MDKIKYNNFRVEEKEAHWAIMATNENTHQDEVVRRYTKKSQAYAYLSKLINHRVIHGNRLKVIMHQKGINEDILANITGYSKFTIQTWKNNLRQPSYGAILYLSEVLSVPKEELITF